MTSKSRPTRGRIGTPYNIERIYSQKQYCKNCIYYEKEDSSCSIKPIVLNEVGFDYYKTCKSFEVKGAQKSSDRDKKIAKVVRSSISNDINLREVAKSFNISLYKALVIYNDVYRELNPINESSINKLKKYGLSDKKIAEFYDVNIGKFFNKKYSKKEKKEKTQDKKLNTDKKITNINNENASIVKDASKGMCSLCNRKDKSNNIYYIDDRKIEDIDSVLNMTMLCERCSGKVTKNKSEYEDKLKKKANEIMEEIILA